MPKGSTGPGDRPAGASGAPLEILAWPGLRTQSPHVWMMYQSMLDHHPGVVVHDFAVGRHFWSRPDVVHIHWPERASDSGSTARAVVKSALTLLHLLVWWARRIPVVWTVHNLTGHDRRRPRLEGVVRRMLLVALRGSIHLSDAARDAAMDIHPPLERHPSVVIPLPAIPLPAATVARSDGDVVAIAAGRIAAYKNTPLLVRTFVALGPDHPSRLVVAGRPEDEAIRNELEPFAEDDRVTLELRWLDDAELAELLATAHVAIMPYSNLLNSGVALDALAAGVPVAVTASPATRDLLDQVGPEWVRLITDGLDEVELEAILRWASAPREGAPDLGTSMSTTADDTLEFLRTVARCAEDTGAL